jgi:hypothetical protein
MSIAAVHVEFPIVRTSRFNMVLWA